MSHCNNCCYDSRFEVSGVEVVGDQGVGWGSDDRGEGIGLLGQGIKVGGLRKK